MDLKQTEKILKALANRRRLAILVFLSKVRRVNVTDIAREIKLSFKSTSRHLAVLRGADLLEREQVNLVMFYSIHEPKDVIVKAILKVQ